MARVGLLEDNTRIAKLCVTMLNYAGHDVMLYMDAQECLQALAVVDLFTLPPAKGLGERSPLPIDVLILDLHLPTMPGLEVLQRLRSHPRTSMLPLIFCTAAPISEINLALTIAPDAMLVEKPFKLQTLVTAISESLMPESQTS
ncbi:MAG TPA: response regulator [Ktedonobacteraceae bacterium]|jgi:CheY-like chemotaxis protein